MVYQSANLDLARQELFRRDKRRGVLIKKSTSDPDLTTEILNVKPINSKKFTANESIVSTSSDQTETSLASTEVKDDFISQMHDLHDKVCGECQQRPQFAHMIVDVLEVLDRNFDLVS